MRIPFFTQSVTPSPFLELGEVPTHVRGSGIGCCGSRLGIPFPVNGADVGGACQGLPERIDAMLCEVEVSEEVGASLESGEGKMGDVPICSMASESSLSVRLSCR